MLRLPLVAAAVALATASLARGADPDDGSDRRSVRSPSAQSVGASDEGDAHGDQAGDGSPRGEGWSEENDGWGDEGDRHGDGGGWTDEDDVWGEDESWDSPWGEGGGTWTGFLELAAGGRIEDNPPLDRTETLEELRLRVERSWAPGSVTIDLKADLELDGVIDEVRVDPRELALGFAPADGIDVKLGRQILTWGTGDLIFLNDLFPKDFQSFFAGREDDYLKAPSDAVRATWYGRVNLDVAWTPVFDPDRYLTGERFSFFVPGIERQVAPDQGRVPAPDDVPEDGELALRLFKSMRGVELAAYGYRGFFKGPVPDGAGGLRFPRLNAFGASVRGPLAGGIANAEVAWYDSRSTDEDPAAPRDQWRVLVGFEREIATRVTLGLQAYVERTLDHTEVLAAAPDPATAIDETRGLVTARLTHRDSRERLTTSLFVFASPTDEDFHLRPRVDYRYSDAWTFTAGANLFGGSEPHTFFGQLDGNDNVYVRVRRNF